MKNNFIVRTAQLQELSFFLQSAEKEGWNPGQYDAEAFYTVDPHGFFIGELNGDKIGCISAVAYNKEFGFLGFYIIKPEFRHCGYGIQLWNAAMKHLGKRNCGLDGVIEQQDNYKKSGFQLYYKNIRFENSEKPLSNSFENLFDSEKIYFEELLKYDTSILGISRKAFLKKWIHMPNAHFLCSMVDDKITGYGVIRSCVKGWKIGPLFADTQEIALQLYQGLCSKIDSGPIYLDAPEINYKALAIAQHFDMKIVFETARMYTQTPPASVVEKIFGVTSFELG